MIVDELRSGVSVTRIHDEYCAREPQDRLRELNQIVSESYRRRALTRAARKSGR